MAPGIRILKALSRVRSAWRLTFWSPWFDHCQDLSGPSDEQPGLSLLGAAPIHGVLALWGLHWLVVRDARH
jgi:hypothetical protein